MSPDLLRRRPAAQRRHHDDSTDTARPASRWTRGPRCSGLPTRPHLGHHDRTGSSSRPDRPGLLRRHRATAPAPAAAPRRRRSGCPTPAASSSSGATPRTTRTPTRPCTPNLLDLSRTPGVDRDPGWLRDRRPRRVPPPARWVATASFTAYYTAAGCPSASRAGLCTVDPRPRPACRTPSRSDSRSRSPCAGAATTTGFTTLAAITRPCHDRYRAAHRRLGRMRSGRDGDDAGFALVYVLLVTADHHARRRHNAGRPRPTRSSRARSQYTRRSAYAAADAGVQDAIALLNGSSGCPSSGSRATPRSGTTRTNTRTGLTVLPAAARRSPGRSVSSTSPTTPATPTCG